MKKHEVCVCDVRGYKRKRGCPVRTKLSVQRGRQQQQVQDKLCDVYGGRPEVSTGTAWKICRDEAVFVQKAAESAIIGRWNSETLRCCDRVPNEDNPGVVNATRFSNEAHFHLDGYINKQNVRFWASENPRFTVANSLHP
jgi:hypothetical protein